MLTSQCLQNRTALFHVFRVCSQCFKLQSFGKRSKTYLALSRKMKGCAPCRISSSSSILPHRTLCTLPGAFGNIQEDKYNGITLDLNGTDLNIDQFKSFLTDSIPKWKDQSRTCIWIKVPIDKSAYIPVAAEFGFQFHHAEHNSSLLKLWLDPEVEDRTPRYATHQVGVSGMVYREDTKEILVVKDKNSQFSYWKFPGGLSDLGEDIGDTAEREVLEETGIKAEFLSVLALRQQHQQPGAFGRSDFFFVCRLKPLNFDIKHCENEISHCKWMSFAELYENTEKISPITNRMCQILQFGMDNGFDSVDITFKEMKSVYKGLKYKLYHRPIDH